MVRRPVTASMDLVNILLQYASGLGLSLASLEAATGLVLDDLENPDTRVPIEQLNTIWHELVERSGARDFGLHLGEMADSLSTRGILFSVMSNCATVGKALEKLVHYHSLATDFVRLHLSQQGETVCCVWEPIDAAIQLDRHYTETVFCSLVFPLRRLTQSTLQPVAIHFTHPCPQDITEHQRLFGCSLVFGAPLNKLILLREDLEQPILLANAQLLNRLEQFAQETLARIYPPNTWAERVIHLINKRLACGEKPTLDSAAKELAISPRQLQNKLREEEVTYQSLLDTVRKEMALKYLGEPQITVCDIAFLLGFSEQSAFNHAFRRWTGDVPGNYRKSGLSTV
jgi:AraC-like DNA-binding protein